MNPYDIEILEPLIYNSLMFMDIHRRTTVGMARGLSSKDKTQAMLSITNVRKPVANYISYLLSQTPFKVEYDPKNEEVIIQ